ncbi:MAG: glycine cleavage system aminomethyltransferase GcvT [Spirochaetales bacterium]|nr:glycine cleavage system aminomethyltransferase GcvT [Spirochaetales bacterium]
MSVNKKLDRTPLYKNHKKIDAKLAPFAGWEMPEMYGNILKEHLHTRSANSIFDICHMGEFIIEGKKAEKDLENLLSCGLASLGSGRCRYGFLLNDEGFFIDDLIIFKYSCTRFMIVVNSSRITNDAEWICSHLSTSTSFTNISDKTAKIDLQGPLSFKTASSVFPDIEFVVMNRFAFIEFEYEGIKLTASTTGYTGELGFEFFMPPESAVTIWELLLEVDSVKPAGLSSRNSLRLEKGLPLYGYDITDKITPIEANLERFVNFNKDFIGKDALIRQIRNKPARILTPFLCAGRSTAREGFTIYKDNKPAGVVTSGVFSPMLNKGIGLAMIDQSISAVGTIIECRKDDTKINAVIIDLPFIR